MTYETIGLIANISLALSFLVALVIGIAESREAARSRRERLTLETLRNFQTREFSEISAQVSYRKPPASYEEFYSLTLHEQAEYVQFSQQMESLGILVAEQLIDLDLVDKTLGLFVTTSWQKYKAVFEVLREKQSDPFLGEYFQWLAECIEDRMQKHPRKPFHQIHGSSRI